ncbi:MAG: CTP synthase [Candidatus Pacearchaeota archaeon]|nr:CTP synthase [Candidatus Pacearchaeota archaeon]
MVKYIFVIGGVISGVGKGVAAASIGKILQKYGHDVTAIKIDPYINCDAGTLRPTEHGEVWVTEDGGETDQDLGNYERFLRINVPKRNNITTGQIYKTIIDKERNGSFLGQTVQFIPHVIEEIKSRIVEGADEHGIAIVEIGGTVGDYENIAFLLAAKKLERELGRGNVIYILVSYLPVPMNIKEAKTKPTQQSIRMLYELGIFPDFILCRALEPIDDVRKSKIASYININEEDIISAPDTLTLYQIPLNFEKENLGKKILQKLNLIGESQPDWSDWQKLISRLTEPKNSVNIAIVGKYLDIGNFTLEDSYISIKQSLLHGGAHLDIQPNIFWINSKDFEKDPEKLQSLNDYDGVIVPGGFGSSGVEGKIKAIKYCRENRIPYLGLCYGLHLAVVEIARSKIDAQADTTENAPETSCPVIDLLPKQKEMLKENKYGATMRLGAYAAKLEENTIVYDLYKKFSNPQTLEEVKIMQNSPTTVKIDWKLRVGNTPAPIVFERHRHRYEVNPQYHDVLQKAGIIFSGYHLTEENTKLVEFIELSRDVHPFFVATQAHPEFKSSFDKPSPLFAGFLDSCLKKKTSSKLK